MSGSGNDFVFINAFDDEVSGRRAADPGFVRAVCAPHTGVGADGIAILQPSATQDFTLRYFNRDGSNGELCGNASLCATRLAVDLGLGEPAGLGFESGAGVIRGRMRDGLPEIDLQPPTGLRVDAGIARLPGEDRLGFVNTGVPHLVIRTADPARATLTDRGPELRYHSSLENGANVNWVGRSEGGEWEMRTYERGVESETLACGTGAAACAVLLNAWGESGESIELRTRSGRVLSVTLRDSGPALRGEGRIVFEGKLAEL